MSSTRVESLLADAHAAFDRPPETTETGLDTSDPAVLQLRKACRLLGGARTLHEHGYYTLVVEAAFVAIERTIDFRLLDRGIREPSDLPGTHTGTYHEAAANGMFDQAIADELADLWTDHRAKTYYRDGKATARRGAAVLELASEVHSFLTGRASSGYACRCDDEPS